MGSLGTCIIIAETAPRQPLAAVAANDAYKNAAWAWLKALFGISMFEGSLLTVVAGARRAALLATSAAGGGGGGDSAGASHGHEPCGAPYPT